MVYAGYYHVCKSFEGMIENSESMVENFEGMIENYVSIISDTKTVQIMNLFHSLQHRMTKQSLSLLQIPPARSIYDPSYPFANDTTGQRIPTTALRMCRR